MAMKTLLRFVFGILLIAVFDSCSKDPAVYQPVSDPVIRIGVLLPMTGSGSSSGNGMAAAVELARQDLAGWIAATGTKVRLIVEVSDTRTDTAEALRLLKTYWASGIRLVVGPYSSAELSHIKSFADRNGMILVSPSSVAVSLSVPDNLFRFVTPDVVQGKAMSKLLFEDKVKVIVPVHRNDLWGHDLAQATGFEFSQRGGSVHEAVTYDPLTSDFHPVLAELEAAVADEMQHHNANDIAVYMLSFSEGTGLLALAKNYPNLNNVYWYGASAFSQNVSVLADTAAALFAYSHGLPCPVFGLDDAASGKWMPLRDRIVLLNGVAPDVYAYTAYDALQVLVRTALLTGDKASAEQVKSVFAAEAGAYFGVTGNTALDANGDRATGNYDFWSVKLDSAGYGWKRTARYFSATGILVRQ